jgi:hypothetical protein
MLKTHLDCDLGPAIVVMSVWRFPCYADTEQTTMSRSTKGVFDRDRLARDLEEGYSRVGWVGASLRPVAARVGPDEAGWRPPHLKHSLAEILLHCAYWKNRVRHRLLGDRKRSFPLKGSDWFPVEADLDEDRWAEMLAIIDREHDALCETVKTVKVGPSRGEGFAARMAPQVRGIAQHDMYHTGQMRLIRAQYERAVGA